jgi:HEAT repeats
MRRALAILFASLPASAIGAQSIAQRVAAADRPVQIVFPSRPSTCGDGRTYINHVLDDRSSYTNDGGEGWSRGPCVHGPARVVATVMGGEVTRLRSYVGPVPSSNDVETITASAADAAAWLGSLITRENSRVAESAIYPLILADAPDPWPLLLRTARDNERSQNVRRESLFWLGNGAVAHLGLDSRDDSPDDEMRTQAVFALSQRPRAESVPALIDVVRTAKHPSAKRSAIFWLGQTGDPRAADVFAELLGLR